MPEEKDASGRRPHAGRLRDLLIDWAMRLRAESRAWRARLLEPLMERERSPILDLGAGEGDFEGVLAGSDRPIVALDRNLRALQRLQARFPAVYTVVGDATELPFRDQGFGLVLSNSVIEHLDEVMRQTAMAREVRRVGRSFMVQTPNRYFPIEPHFLVPFWQFLPRVAQIWISDRVPLGHYVRGGARRDSIRLLSKAQLGALFPDARLVEEKIGPLTKSLIALKE